MLVLCGCDWWCSDVSGAGVQAWVLVVCRCGGVCGGGGVQMWVVVSALLLLPATQPPPPRHLDVGGVLRVCRLGTSLAVLLR